jgi:hypothetical protein
MKYVIPRNKLIPDPAFEDVLQAGPRFTDKGGNPVGDPLTLYRGNDMSFPKSAKLIEGMQFLYNEGMVYIPKFASHADVYFDLSRQALKAGATIVLGGAVESIVGELPIYLGALVHTGIEHKLFPEKEHDASHLKMIAADLVTKGAVYLPYVQLVEIEYQMIPPKFLRKAEHRFLFTYERLNGERTTYGFWMYSSNPLAQDKVVLGWIDARLKSEFGYLVPMIQREESNSEQVWASHVEKYQSRYGEKWREHGAELVTEFKNACDEELERKGFKGQRLHAATLERIAPLVPYYREIPRFKEMVQFLESGDMEIKFTETLDSAV